MKGLRKIIFVLPLILVLKYKVQMTAGELVRRTVTSGMVVYEGFGWMNKFVYCNITFDRLKEFNTAFERISNYQLLIHNCHVFHRSLMATATCKTEELLYNYREGWTIRTIRKLMFVSCDRWVAFKSGDCRNEFSTFSGEKMRSFQLQSGKEYFNKFRGLTKAFNRAHDIVLTGAN